MISKIVPNQQKIVCKGLVIHHCDWSSVVCIVSELDQCLKVTAVEFLIRRFIKWLELFQTLIKV